MRRILDALYAISAGLAALFLVMIAVLIGSAIVGRWFGVLVPSADDFAGYCMAASAFLGLAPTLRTGGHIRIAMLLAVLGPRSSRFAESIAILVGIALFAMLAYNTTLQNFIAYQNQEMSTGIVPIPVWVPQLGMTIGVIIMLVALVDELLRVLRGGGVARHEDPALAVVVRQREGPQNLPANGQAGGR